VEHVLTHDSQLQGVVKLGMEVIIASTQAAPKRRTTRDLALAKSRTQPTNDKPKIEFKRR
jgi:hypothetical protein